MTIPEFPRDVASFPIRALKYGTVEQLSVSAVEAVSATIDSTVVRLASDIGLKIAFAADPTASAAGGSFLPANTIEYLALNSGDKLAAIAKDGASSGTLYITLLT